MKLGERIALLRKNPDTERVGKKWENSEYEQLLVEIHQGIPIEEIAKRHKRPVSSIIYRLHVASVFLLYNGYTLNQASSLTKLAPFNLLNFTKNVMICEVIKITNRITLTKRVTFEYTKN